MNEKMDQSTNFAKLPSAKLCFCITLWLSMKIAIIGNMGCGVLWLGIQNLIDRGWAKKKYTNGFRSGGNILGQSASKC